jgi:hypothetical protein
MADSPFEAVALGLQQIIATEFAAEGYTAILDNLHESLGAERTEIGIAPIEDYPRDNNELMQETYVEIKFYDLWTQEIDPTTIVDPTRITGYAERLKKAIRSSFAADPGTDQVWFFSVRRTKYPNDPTGNKTRFEMTIRAFGNNAGLTESNG